MKAEVRPRWLGWAALLRRVFEVDVLRRDTRGGRREGVAFIPTGERAQEVLERPGLDATAPSLAKARAPPEQLDGAG